jgi:hypothetical protein
MLRYMLHNETGAWARARGDCPEDHWTAVTAEAPCEVCGATNGCAAMRDERFVRCVRRPSDWPMTVGGWLHRSSAWPLVREAPPLAQGSQPGSAGGRPFTPPLLAAARSESPDPSDRA